MIAHRKHTAFTLAELLVAIAILVILIAILIPTLRRARDLGNQTVCLSSLRQIAIAVRGYAIENIGYMPAPYDDSGSYKTGWLYTHPKSSPSQQSDVETGIVYKYLAASSTDTTAIANKNANYKIFHCPADLPPYTDPYQLTLGLPFSKDGRARTLTSYIMNFASCAFGARARPALRLDQMRPDGIIFWEADETGELSTTDGGRGDVRFLWDDGTSWPQNGLSRRHGSGAGVATYSGSAEWMTRNAYNNELLLTPGRLWCNPLNKNGKD